jgi:hypothetical protein
MTGVRGLAISWASFLLLYAVAAGYLHFRVAHPHFFPVAFLLAATALFSSMAVLLGAWRVVRGPRRLAGFRLLWFASIPPALILFHVTWVVRFDVYQRRPTDYLLRVMIPMAESLMDLEARFRYPQRTEGRHVVMIHDGIADSDAHAQVEAMDRHIERMENLLGQKTEGKCHWVRGRLLGRQGLCLFGIALGSTPGSGAVGPDGLTTLDRHEVAHWTVDCFFRPYQIFPSSMLAEGWAESQAGYAPSELYGNAWQHWQSEISWKTLRELIPPASDAVDYRMYAQGGVLVDYLLSRYGGPRFFELYHDRRHADFNRDCERLLGVDLDSLEQAYARHLVDTVRRHGSMEQWRLEDLRCAPDVDRSKWQQFLKKYLSQTLSPLAFFDNCRLRVERTWKNSGANKPVGWQAEYLVSKPLALAFERSNNFQAVALARPEWSRQIRKGKDQPSWEVSPTAADAARAHRGLYRDIDRQIQGLFRPSLLNSDIWLRGGTSLSTVTELTEYQDSGKPRVRVCIRLPQSGPWAGWRRWTLAVDQAYVPLIVEQGDARPTGIEVFREEIEYVEAQGHPLVSRIQGRTSAEDGRLLQEFTMETRETSFDRVDEKRFSLETLGIDKDQLPEPPVGHQTPPFGWQPYLYWLPAGWALAALCLGTLVGRRQRNVK